MTAAAASQLQRLFCGHRSYGVALRILDFMSPFVVRCFGIGVTQHHQRIASRTKKIVALLDHLAVLAVVEPKFFPPIIVLLEHLQLAHAHPWALLTPLPKIESAFYGC